MKDGKHVAAQQRPAVPPAGPREHRNAERRERELGLGRHVLPRRHDAFALRRDLAVGQLEQPRSVDDVDGGGARSRRRSILPTRCPWGGAPRRSASMRATSALSSGPHPLPSCALGREAASTHLPCSIHSKSKRTHTANNGGELSRARSARLKSINWAPCMWTLRGMQDF